MSGSTIGGVVGGVIGVFFGAPQLGFVIGSAIGGAIDPEEIRGPSIGDAQRQTSQAGVPRPVVYGHPAPFMGNLIDGEAQARKIEQTESAKGGPEVTTERFILSSAIRICEGPIAGVLRIWRNDQLVFDRTDDGDFPDWDATLQEIMAYVVALRAKTNAFDGKIALYFGTEDQLPDPTLEAIHGVGNTPYYRGTAYMVVTDDDVTDMRGASAQWKFEVLQAGTDGDAPEVTPNVTSPPTAGYSAGGVFVISTSSAPLVPAIPSGVRLAQLQVQNADAVATYPGRPRAPRAGLFDANRFNPGRLVLADSSGTIYYDSGWMGDPVQQTDLNFALAEAGMPGGVITPFVQTHNITFPPVIPPLIATFYVAGFPWGVGSTGVGSPQIIVQFPDPALLPDSYTVSPEFPDALLGSDGQLYYPSWVTPPTLTTLTPGDVYLAPTVVDIAGRCNVPAEKLDVSELALNVLPGLLVAQQGPGADCILPTQRAFFYDTPEFDGKIRAVKRGGAIAVSITEDDLLDLGDEERQDRPQQVEFPRLVSVVTQDPDANYAPVPQTSIRTSLEVQATNEVQLPLAIPFRADESKRIAEKLHKVLWAQAEGRIELPLPEAYSRLVPSDCIAYAGRRWLVEQTDYADGEMRVRAAYDRASAYASAATGQPAPPPALPSAGLAGPTDMEWLNLPILSDLDDALGFYMAVSGGDGWRGARIDGSIDGGATWEPLVTVNARSVMGRLVTALPDAIREVIDATNTVRVEVRGELSSITFEQLLNEGNPCVIGDEVCQFQTATFVSDGVYDLSVLTRGRLNTDPVAHAVGDRFVLLNAPVFIPRPSSWVGRSILLRAVSVGTSSAAAPVVGVVWSPARSQVEWEPVGFSGSRDTSNNVAISWIGQGRLGSNKSPANSQHFDGYRLTLTKSAASVSYTTTVQSFAYSAAQQTIDFGSATGTLSVSIVALNRFTGASAALTGSIP